MNAGVKGVAEEAFVPLAADSLNDLEDLNKTDIFANAEYNVTRNIKTTVDALYKKDYEFDKDKEVKFEPTVNATLLDDALEVSSSFLFLDEAEEAEADDSGYEEGELMDLEPTNRRFKVDATWDKPINGLDHVTTNLKVDTEDDDEIVDDIDDVEDYDIMNLFVEAQTGIVPFTNYIKANSNQRLDLGINDYYAEASLDIPVDQFDYVNAEVYYTQDEYNFEEDAMKYKVSGSLHHLPAVSDYVTHLTGEFEADEDEIIDNGNYDDDDNDWKNKVAASTMLDAPMVEDFHGLTIEADMLQLEDGKAMDDPDLDEDLNAKYVVEGSPVEWYNTLTLLTGYDFSDDFRVNVTHKVGLNHSDFISKYEDDALKVEFTKEFNQYSTFNASLVRNGAEGEYEDTVEVLHELSF
jgi:hypothetical protein